jgi:hypothetical protein
MRGAESKDATKGGRHPDTSTSVGPCGKAKIHKNVQLLQQKLQVL